MSSLVSLFFILLFQGYNQYSAFAKDSFIAKPDEEVYSHEGSDVTLDWDFKVVSSSSSPRKVSEFLFGTWVSPGFVRNKILVVQAHNVVLKRRGFERKVDWSGNIYDCVECKAKIKMYNLTSADFKTYGVEVELGLHRKPLINWLVLVKFEPVKIIKWQRRIKVEEGNATAIECKATGRPTPSVIIKTNNRTLCNSTGYCVYLIPAAKPLHEGQYLCLVQQRNSSQIRRSLNLTVLEGRTTPETPDIEDNRTTNNTPEDDTPMSLELVIPLVTAIVVAIVIMILLCLCLYVCIKRRAGNRKRENVHGVSGYSPSQSGLSAALVQINEEFFDIRGMQMLVLEPKCTDIAKL